ncbi:universal stress protein [Antrihabitans sp. YC2-6]|uniref:universal stress protein n=1 Tax=Antrihabitans sp. YC2-6 TaxID=2799498 RepID=UPI0018F4946D|nr:universal stress protein [Antrihabitans sp. YC2-6]MBJ8346978.1 universal stress protein [Antrihabitans sp. YC2-6]
MAMTLDPQSVVVGIDGSRAALHGALWAARIADVRHAPLAIVHTVPSGRYFGGDDELPIEAAFRRQDLGRAKRLLAHTASMVRKRYQEVDVSWRIRPGVAADVLLELSVQASLVVVGATGRTRAGARILGSTALQVSNAASSPVAVFRGQPDSRVHVLGDPRPVVVGVDGGATSERAVGQAFDYAAMLRVPVIAVHMWSANHLPYGAEVSPDVDRQSENALLAECLAGWAEKFPDVVVIRVCKEGNAVTELLARSTIAQLIVVGSHGYGPLSGLVHGSTSQTLTSRSSCTVLVSRESL